MKITIPNRTRSDKIMEIDDEDWDKIKDLNLTQKCESNKNTIYAKHTVYIKQKYIKTIHIHRLVMGLGDYKNDKRIIHHIDGDGLNNKKSNLEICDNMYNSQSCRRRNNKQGLVYIDTSNKRKKIWRAVIVINKVRYQARFLTEDEANEFIESKKLPNLIKK